MMFAPWLTARWQHFLTPFHVTTPLTKPARISYNTLAHAHALVSRTNFLLLPGYLTPVPYTRTDGVLLQFCRLFARCGRYYREATTQSHGQGVAYSDEFFLPLTSKLKSIWYWIYLFLNEMALSKQRETTLKNVCGQSHAQINELELLSKWLVKDHP